MSAHAGSLMGRDATPVDELVEQRRARAGRPPVGRERLVTLADGGLLLAAAVTLALVAPTIRSPSALVVAVFVGAYAVASRMEFEVAAGAAVPTQLVFVPMLFVLPAGIVPLAVAVGFVLGNGLDYLSGRTHPERAIGAAACSWYAMGPSVLILLTGERAPAWADAPLYVALLLSQFAVDLLHATGRERLALGIAPRTLLPPLGWVYGVDALLAPAGLLFAFVAADAPFSVVLALPLLVLLGLFARERRARLDHALELSGVRASNRELDELAHRDPLTGIANRRAWDESLPRMLELARQERAPLCVAIVDLDHFKRYNDTHGHLRGDRLLAEAAGAWGRQLRADDLLVRYGGEEFGLALPSCGLENATRLLDRVRRATPEAETCSIGIAEWDRRETPAALVARADTALYRAKSAGRNRMAVSGSPLTAD